MRPIPCLRLFLEALALPAQQGLRSDVEVEELPVLGLSFDYGGTVLRASDSRQQFFVGEAGTIAAVARDLEAETHAARLLEGFGVVDLGCIPDCQTDPSSEADYLLPLEGGIHAWCSFAATALPELTKLGFRVTIDPGYPYVPAPVSESDWYAEVEREEEDGDWFSLDLGVDVGGQRVDLLPMLLSLLDGASADGTLESLVRIPARLRAVPLPSGGFVALPSERLVAILRVLVELYQGAGGHAVAPIPTARLAALGRLEEAWSSGPSLDWRGDSELVTRGRALAKGRTVTALPAHAPIHVEGLRATLRTYQERGLAWLDHLRANDVGGVLADDMGLGKTLQVIAHLLREKRAGRMTTPALVVMPTSLIGNWRREFAKFAPELVVNALHGPKRQEHRETAHQGDVILTTYPLLIRDLEHFRDRRYYYVILDEAQAIKNRSSLAHKAVLELDSEHRLCITGTPVENNLQELRSIFAFVMPNLLGEAEPFQQRFARPIEQGGDADQLRILRDTVSPFLLRRMKEQVATDLPPKTELVRHVELRGEQRELYESIRLAAHSDVRKAIRLKGIAGSSIAILDALMKLRQVCCDPRLVPVQSARLVRSSAKYDLAMELLSAQLTEGRRVLVFSQFTSMLALLSQGLSERGLAHVLLTGATQDRQKVIDAFTNGEADIFLISLKAGGTGLNLTRADTVIHYDPWWNPAAQGQATDRAYRIGQTRPVFVYSLVAAGSVEERMLRLQRRKRQLAETILGTGSSAATQLSPQELDGLFAPLSG